MQETVISRRPVTDHSMAGAGRYHGSRSKRSSSHAVPRLVKLLRGRLPTPLHGDWHNRSRVPARWPLWPGGLPPSDLAVTHPSALPALPASAALTRPLDHVLAPRALTATCPPFDRTTNSRIAPRE